MNRSTPHSTWSPWTSDILGPGFEQCTTELGRDPDGQGQAVATLVRATEGSRDPQRPAVLWLHGMSDYFFQDHLASRVLAQGFAFYALDLRACGRSLRPGQRPHFVTDLRHYFPELGRALAEVASGHRGVILAAHSTGGLIAAVWLDWLREHEEQAFEQVSGLLLDSPWLDLQFGRWGNAAVRVAARALGALAPRLAIPSGELNAYGESIARRWDFDPNLKPVEGHRKYAGWLRAVVRGMDWVGRISPFDFPILTLTSTQSWLGQPYSAASDAADTVLDVEAIWPVARTLGRSSTIRPISGAIHDVYLSLPLAREAALEETARFISDAASACS